MFESHFNDTKVLLGDFEYLKPRLSRGYRKMSRDYKFDWHVRIVCFNAHVLSLADDREISENEIDSANRK